MIATVPSCRDFLGRNDERDFLVRALSAPGGSEPVIASVHGAAGSGKSRLLREVVATLGASGARVPHVECREYEAPFGPVDDILESLGLATIAERTSAGDERLGTIAAEVAGLAVRSPVMFALDDAHWSDLATLDFLDVLAARTKGSQVRFIIAYRADELERLPERARRIERLERRSAWRVTLEPLADAVIERMVEAMLRDAGTTLPRAVTSEIVDLAGGYPLYAEELVRGTLLHQRPTVPLGLRATVRERLDALEPRDRSVLLSASAIGRRFSAPFVARTTGAAERDVFAALDAARSAGLVAEADGRFAFTHALVREIVYDAARATDVQALHRRIADELIASGTAELDPGVAAEHFHRAGDAERSVRWNVAAGERADAIDAHVDAARFFTRAYEDARDGAQRGALAVHVADAWYAEGDMSAAAQWLERADAHYRDAGDEDGASRCALQQARMLQESGRADEALAAVDAIAQAHSASSLGREAAVMAASILIGQDRPKDALGRLESIREIEAPARDWEVRGCGIAGVALGKLGRWREGRTMLARAAACGRALGDPDVLLRILNNQANLENEFDVPAARAAYAEALELAKRRRNRRLDGWISSNAAYSAWCAGDLRAAADALERADRNLEGLHAARVFSAALAQRIATQTGNERIAGADPELLAGELTRAGPKLLGAAAGALALDRLSRGAHAEARTIVEEAAPRVLHIEGSYWFAEAVARTATPRTRAAVRNLLLDALGEGASIAEAYLAFFDAIVAARERRAAAAAATARDAAAAFARCGYLLMEADALVVAGETARALAIYEAAGATAEVARLARLEGPRRRGDASLTPREREIAGFLREGKSAREIAQILVISERTVETHVASIYRRLGVSTRGELLTRLEGL